MRHMVENASHKSRDKNKNARVDLEMIRDRPPKNVKAQIILLDLERVTSLLF